MEYSFVTENVGRAICARPCTEGADPGFPIGGDANPPGAQTYDFAKFSQKMHEIEKNLGRTGVPYTRHINIMISARE